MNNNILSDMKKLFIVRDSENLSCGLWLAINPRKGLDVAGPEWKFFKELRLNDEQFPEITWESEPVPARLVKIAEEEMDESSLWLGRNADGSLCLSHAKPQRNSVNPWWSARGKFEWTDDEVFPELTWESEPMAVKIAKG